MSLVDAKFLVDNHNPPTTETSMKPPQKTGGGVSALSELVNKTASRPPSGPSEEAMEEKLDADVSKLLELVSRLAGEDLFDMQTLIEACAEELREQIRMSVEEEGE